MSIAMAYNVPVVCDVFLCPIRKNAKHFYGRKKMCWSKTAQRALARLRFCSSTFGAGVIATQCPITCPKRRKQPKRYVQLG